MPFSHSYRSNLKKHMAFGTHQVDQLGGGYERNMSKKQRLEEG